MEEYPLLKTAMFVFDDDMVMVGDMSREQLIQALEWTLQSANNHKKHAEKMERLLDMAQNKGKK